MTSTPNPPVPPSGNVAKSLADAVAAYRDDSNVSTLHERIEAIMNSASVDELIGATEPFREIPEVAGVVYERIVKERPEDARAIVILASSYWLAGRGPDVVGELASRAISADPSNRGGWHLWALTEADPRARTERWRQLVQRFPDDQLAMANLADNAASLAGAEHDPVALALAIDTYRELRSLATHPAQRAALDAALKTLGEWRM
jgi:hypothetical protein